MQNLSHLIPGDPVTALAPTSQAGGNMMSSNELAMTAPGSKPVDPLPDRDEQGDPHVDALPAGRPGTDGKPRTRAVGAWSPSAPAWGSTQTPDVVREQP